jgi:hypothetical protein
VEQGLGKQPQAVFEPAYASHHVDTGGLHQSISRQTSSASGTAPPLPPPPTTLPGRDHLACLDKPPKAVTATVVLPAPPLPLQ